MSAGVSAPARAYSSIPSASTNAVSGRSPVGADGSAAASADDRVAGWWPVTGSAGSEAPSRLSTDAGPTVVSAAEHAVAGSSVWASQAAVSSRCQAAPAAYPANVAAPGLPAAGGDRGPDASAPGWSAPAAGVLSAIRRCAAAGAIDRARVVAVQGGDHRRRLRQRQP